MQLEFFWDAEGDARARCKGKAKVIAGFLESDLQDSTRAAHEVLRAIDDVESGRETSWEMTGNAHTLTLTPDGASIVDEMDDEAEPYILSLAAFREVLADWVSFLEDGRRT
jgi:uncharacterized protein YacL (UPF0231 family)